LQTTQTNPLLLLVAEMAAIRKSLAKKAHDIENEERLLRGEPEQPFVWNMNGGP
jgi:hypothetical protein